MLMRLSSRIHFVLKTLQWIFLILALTVLTQTGGLVLLLCLPLFAMMRTRVQQRWKRTLSAFAIFSAGYLIAWWLFTPLLARVAGRVPLPARASAEMPVAPANVLTCIFNRHYVRTSAWQTVRETALHFRRSHPGAVLTYLDAGFPTGITPMWPHLSHRDGRKVDFAFQYRHAITGKYMGRFSPSFTGYGCFESPRTSEYNQPGVCAEKGYWQYGFSSLLSIFSSHDCTTDASATADAIRSFAAHPLTTRIFLEPHLKRRWHLTDAGKIRFHGCAAARHDDHFHVEMR